MNVPVVQGDLLDQDVDVIVNAWNRNIIPWWLLLPQGVSGAIKKRGGTGPFKELRKHGPIPLGGAVLTSADGQPVVESPLAPAFNATTPIGKDGVEDLPAGTGKVI